MKYAIREIKENEIFVLEDFLYEAIFIPPGVLPPPKEITSKPQLQVYVRDFGKKRGDIALLSEVNGRIVGAVWTRLMEDYGHIDNETPSLAISLYKEYRNLGIGTAMMKEMLRLLKKNGYKRVSLSVQKTNYAVKMYKDVGFCVFDENREDYRMVCAL